MLSGNWMDENKLEELREGARNTSIIRSLWRGLQMKF